MNHALGLALAVTLLVVGCFTPTATNQDPFGGAPDDFSLDVTVLAKPAATADVDSLSKGEAHLRPSRYILFADGSLRYGPDPEGKLGVDWVPPLTRILSRRQTTEVWTLAQQLGLTDAAPADPIVNFRFVKAQVGERVYLVAFTGSEQRWNFVRRGAVEDPADPAIGQLVRRLARLAWVDESPDSESRIMPKRYDFGPDPYSRYRGK